MYQITKWRERYEVNDKGQPARAGDKLRVRPLEYIRSKVHGLDEGAGFYALRLKAKSRVWEVFGIFQKFLEIAGKSGAENRGTLLNHQGNAATIEDLAHALRTHPSKITFAVQMLTDTTVAWMTSDSLEETPEIPGKSGALYNGTERNVTKQNIPGKSGKGDKHSFLEFVSLTTDEHEKLTKTFGTGMAADYIDRLNSYIGSTGKKYKSHYHTILNWARKDVAQAGAQPGAPPPLVRNAEGKTPGQVAREQIEKSRKEYESEAP